jgi:outer membrane lipoprotein-sorting protein
LGEWRVRGWTVLAGVLATVVAAHAAALCDSTEACLRVVEESQRSTRALTARFEQTKHLSLLAEPLVSRGRFAFKQPDQVLWQMEEPSFTVRIDQQGVHLPDLPNAQAEVAAMAPFSAMLRELSGVFTGSLSNVRRTFEVQAEGDVAAIRVRLVPRSPQWQRMFRAIELSFATPDMVMKTIRLDEALGDHLEIVFSDVHRNDAVADAAFDAAK